MTRSAVRRVKSAKGIREKFSTRISGQLGRRPSMSAEADT